MTKRVDNVDELPSILRTSDVVRLSGQPSWRIRRLMRRSKAVTKNGGRYETTIGLLMQYEPTISSAILARLEARRRAHSLPPDASAAGKLRVILARQDSSDARMRAVEAEVRRLRGEIRKVARRLRTRLKASSDN